MLGCCRAETAVEAGAAGPEDGESLDEVRALDPTLHCPWLSKSLMPIAPAEELTHECSTKDTRKSKTLVDYR